MGDFGSTTFGYTIAYVIPGLTAAVGAGFISSHVEKLFSTVINEQNIPLAVMGAVGALAVGLFLSLFRALIFEEGIYRSKRLSADDYSTLGDDEQTYNAYRYHQSLRFDQIKNPITIAIMRVRNTIVSATFVRS